MIRYKDIGNDSGITAYENGNDYISIQFDDGGVYNYSYSSVGKADVERMKQLADIGIGLNEFVNVYVRKLYEWRR